MSLSWFIHGAPEARLGFIHGAPEARLGFHRHRHRQIPRPLGRREARIESRDRHSRGGLPSSFASDPSPVRRPSDVLYVMCCMSGELCL